MCVKILQIFRATFKKENQEEEKEEQEGRGG